MIIMVKKVVIIQILRESYMDCVDIMQQSHLMGIPEVDMNI